MEKAFPFFSLHKTSFYPTSKKHNQVPAYFLLNANEDFINFDFFFKLIFCDFGLIEKVMQGERVRGRKGTG